MICKTPTEVLLHDALKDLLESLPSPECNDFHHDKKDRHEGFNCPCMKRFHEAKHRAYAAIYPSR